MTEKEMENLIQSVCNQFQRDTGINVTKAAVEEFLKPAIAHLADVTRELRESSISFSFLQESIRTVLDNARPIARRREHKYIGWQDVKDSIAEDCPYAFWC